MINLIYTNTAVSGETPIRLINTTRLPITFTQSGDFTDWLGMHRIEVEIGDIKHVINCVYDRNLSVFAPPQSTFIDLPDDIGDNLTITFRCYYNSSATPDSTDIDVLFTPENLIEQDVSLVDCTLWVGDTKSININMNMVDSSNNVFTKVAKLKDFGAYSPEQPLSDEALLRSPNNTTIEIDN